MNGTPDGIANGWLVYTADDKKIGTVNEVNRDEGYLHLHKGWIFAEDLYIPLDAIVESGDGSVRLRYTEDEIERRRWDTPPPSRVSAINRDDRDEPTIRMEPVGELSRAFDDALTLRLHEEELVTQTREVEAGHLGVHKRVVEEPDTVAVEVRHEVAYVERVPMDAAYHGTDAFREMVIEIPLMSERLLVGKRAHVVEEVRVYKETVTEQRQVTEQVRKERVVVEEHDVEEGHLVGHDRYSTER